MPGIGKKTAERLLLEMRSKLNADISITPHAVPDNQPDILNALLPVGLLDKESLAALKTVTEGVSVSDGIRQALKPLVR